MTREEIISGLKFTIEMFLFDPITGETLIEPRNAMDKTTIDACKGAIELLEQNNNQIISVEERLFKVENPVVKSVDCYNLWNIYGFREIKNID